MAATLRLQVVGPGHGDALRLFPRGGIYQDSALPRPSATHPTNPLELQTADPDQHAQTLCAGIPGAASVANAVRLEVWVEPGAFVQWWGGAGAEAAPIRVASQRVSPLLDEEEENPFAVATGDEENPFAVS